MEVDVGSQLDKFIIEPIRGRIIEEDDTFLQETVIRPVYPLVDEEEDSLFAEFNMDNVPLKDLTRLPVTYDGSSFEMNDGSIVETDLLLDQEDLENPLDLRIINGNVEPINERVTVVSTLIPTGSYLKTEGGVLVDLKGDMAFVFVSDSEPPRGKLAYTGQYKVIDGTRVPMATRIA